MLGAVGDPKGQDAPQDQQRHQPYSVSVSLSFSSHPLTNRFLDLCEIMLHVLIVGLTIFQAGDPACEGESRLSLIHVYRAFYDCEVASGFKP